MADENSVVIEITPDDVTFIRKLRDLESAASKSGAAIGDALGSSFTGGATKAIAAAGVAIAGLFTLRAVKNVISESVDAASSAEVALNRVNTAMRLAGTFSEEASAGFKKLADEIQATTTIDDDTALGLAAMARNMSRTNEEAIKLTKAAVDLGSVIPGGPDAALIALNGTLTGSAGRLSRFIPELKSFTEEQLRAGAAIDFVSTRFMGAAAAETNTYAGAVKQLHNVWDNVFEELGNYVVLSPSVVGAVKGISEELAAFGTSLADGRSGVDGLRDSLLIIVYLAEGFTNYVVSPLQTGWSWIKAISLEFAIALKEAQNFAQGLDIALAETLGGGKLGKALGFGAMFDIEEMKARKAETEQLLADLKDNSVNTFAEMGQSGFAETMSAAFERIEQSILKANEAAKQFAGKGGGDGGAGWGGLPELFRTFEQVSGPVESVTQSFQFMSNSIGQSLYKIANDAKQAFENAAANSFRIMVSGVQNGMSAIGRALVRGEDIFAAFGQAMLEALGKTLIEMSTPYILIGMAKIAASYGADPMGWQLVSIGGAMAIAGGALGAIASGGSAKTAGGGVTSGAGGGIAATPDANISTPSMMEEKQSRLTVNIQGNVFDTKETGLRIVEIMQDAFDTSGAKVVTA